MNEHLFLQQVVSSQRVTLGSIALLSDNYMLLVSSTARSILCLVWIIIRRAMG
ncbi:MAG: hypothetical protein LBH78_03115 [Rickettsiales bacterium]|nr:hypothetical protein [Rickettsiales bacterium]